MAKSPKRLSIFEVGGEDQVASRLTNTMSAHPPHIHSNSDDRTQKPSVEVGNANWNNTENHPKAGPSGYEIHNLIGQGTYALVYLAENKLRNPQGWVAVKAISKARTKVNQVKMEILALQRCNHPAVQRFVEYQDDPWWHYLVTEYAYGGELFEHILENGVFTEDDAIDVMQQLFDGVSYLHSIGIIHRDLKPENILLKSAPGDPVLQLMLADFGLAHVSTGPHKGSLRAKTYLGSVLYMAPEIVPEERMYSEKVDVWSLGTIMYILLCGHPPFDDPEENPDEIARQVVAGIIEEEHFDEEDWGGISTEAKELIKNMLQVNPARRCSARDALLHDWTLGQSEMAVMSGSEQDDPHSDSNEMLFSPTYSEYSPTRVSQSFSGDGSSRGDKHTRRSYSKDCVTLVPRSMSWDDDENTTPNLSQSPVHSAAQNRPWCNGPVTEVEESSLHSERGEPSTCQETLIALNSTPKKREHVHSALNSVSPCMKQSTRIRQKYQTDIGADISHANNSHFQIGEGMYPVHTQSSELNPAQVKYSIPGNIYSSDSTTDHHFINNSNPEIKQTDKPSTSQNENYHPNTVHHETNQDFANHYVKSDSNQVDKSHSNHQSQIGNVPYSPKNFAKSNSTIREMDLDTINIVPLIPASSQRTIQQQSSSPDTIAVIEDAVPATPLPMRPSMRPRDRAVMTPLPAPPPSPAMWLPTHSPGIHASVVSSSFRIGSHYEGHSYCGTILYVGHLQGKSGLWVGISLDEAWKGMGTSDGTFNNIRYFQTPGFQNTALFVTFEEALELHNPKSKSPTFSASSHKSAFRSTPIASTLISPRGEVSLSLKFSSVASISSDRDNAEDDFRDAEDFLGLDDTDMELHLAVSDTIDNTWNKNSVLRRSPFGNPLKSNHRRISTRSAKPSRNTLEPSTLPARGSQSPMGGAPFETLREKRRLSANYIKNLEAFTRKSNMMRTNRTPRARTPGPFVASSAFFASPARQNPTSRHRPNHDESTHSQVRGTRGSFGTRASEVGVSTSSWTSASKVFMPERPQSTTNLEVSRIDGPRPRPSSLNPRDSVSSGPWQSLTHRPSDDSFGNCLEESYDEGVRKFDFRPVRESADASFFDRRGRTSSWVSPDDSDFDEWPGTETFGSASTQPRDRLGCTNGVTDSAMDRTSSGSATAGDQMIAIGEESNEIHVLESIPGDRVATRTTIGSNELHTFPSKSITGDTAVRQSDTACGMIESRNLENKNITSFTAQEDIVVAKVENDLNVLHGGLLLHPSETSYSNKHYTVQNNVKDVGYLGNDIVDNVRRRSNSVAGDQLDNNSVVGDQLDNNSVAGDHLDNNSVAGDQLDNKCVAGDQLDNNSVAGDQLDNNCVAGDQLDNNSVAGDQLDNNSVAGDQLDNNSVAGDQLDNNSVAGDQLDNNCVAGDQLDNNSVAGDQLDNNSVAGDQLDNNCVAGDQLDNNSVAGDQLDNNCVAGDQLDNNSVAGDQLDNSRATCPEVNDTMYNAFRANRTIGAESQQLASDIGNLSISCLSYRDTAEPETSKVQQLHQPSSKYRKEAECGKTLKTTGPLEEISNSICLASLEPQEEREPSRRQTA